MGIFTFPALLKRRASDILVPSGLIIPYNGTSAPSGWSLFTDADGRFIIGAGNTYAVGATGGSTSVVTGSSDIQGAHSGSTLTVAPSANIYENYTKGYNVAGGHSHTIPAFSYTPPYYGLRLIKANSNLDKLPANAVMFSNTTISGLTRFSSGDGKLFSSRESIGAGGTNNIGAFTSSNNGAHCHGTDHSRYPEYGAYGYRSCISGEHNHQSTGFTITPNLYRALLSAWTNASAAFDLKAGMYAFYENTTPPTGWYLCDGSNGTLDLRNYFIQFTDETNDGTRAGNGTIGIPNITLSSVENRHAHRTQTDDLNLSDSYHDSYYNTHSHTIPSSNPTFLPPYYALAIIQLAA